MMQSIIVGIKLFISSFWKFRPEYALIDLSVWSMQYCIIRRSISIDCNIYVCVLIARRSMRESRVV